jgi:hypothetical protein
MSPRAHYVAVLVVAVIVTIVHAPGMAPGIVGLFHDDAIYAVVAKSLADGTGYRIMSLPSAPFQAKYPFLYSGVLSVLWRLDPTFPDNITWLKLVNLPALLVSVIGATWLYRRHAGESRASELLVLVLTGTNALVVTFVRMTLTETLFLALATMALALAGSRGNLHLTALAALSAATCLTRTAGVALVFAVFLHLVLRRRYRQALAFAILTGLFISPWIVWQGLRREASASVLLDYYVAYDLSSLAYVTMLSDFPRALQVVIGNVRYLVGFLDAMFLLPAMPVLRLVAYPAVALGALRPGADSGWLLQIFGASYLAVVVAWPWDPSRFVVPLIPILIVFAIRGIRDADAVIRAAVHRRNLILRSVLIAPFVAIMTLQLLWFSLYLARRADAPFSAMERQWSGFVETFVWVRDYTEPGAVLATAFDPMYYLYTGRRAVRPWLYRPETYFYPFGREVPDVGSVADIKPELTRLNVTYLIIDPMEGYVERGPAVVLFEKLLDSYPVRPKPSFVSSDGQHRIYRLPTAHADADDARLPSRIEK